MIKVYDVSRKYIMLFMHNDTCLPLTGLLTLLQWTIQPAPIVHREISEIFQKYFRKYFTPKMSWNFTSLPGTSTATLSSSYTSSSLHWDHMKEPDVHRESIPDSHAFKQPGGESVMRFISGLMSGAGDDLIDWLLLLLLLMMMMQLRRRYFW